MINISSVKKKNKKNKIKKFFWQKNITNLLLLSTIIAKNKKQNTKFPPLQ